MPVNPTTEIGRLLATDEEAAERELLRLLEEHGGNTVHAALHVGVHHSTLKRWIAQLEEAGSDVRARLESIRAQATPRAMSDLKRAKLEQAAARRRQSDILRRAVRRLSTKGRAQFATRAGVTEAALRRWLAGGQGRAGLAAEAAARAMVAKQRRQRASAA